MPRCPAKGPGTGATGSAAIHADKFRYHLLVKRPGIIWADTDI